VKKDSGPEPSDSRLKTPGSVLPVEPSDSTLQSPDSGLETQDSRLNRSDSRLAIETQDSRLPSRLRVGVIFGGRSGEHEVSLRSAESVINAMDRSKYDVVPIAITKEGRWLVSADATALLPQAVMSASDHREVTIVGDPTRSGLLRLDDSGVPSSDSRLESGDSRLDVLLPVLHGTYGEDGTIQGLLEMAGVPYVGCGVLASSAGMDKIVMKQLFSAAGLAVADWDWFLRSQWETGRGAIISRVAARLPFPLFVKPANLGSSVGISKARDAKELAAAIDEAARYDRRILVEQEIAGREIEVSVLGNDEPVASLPGEIIPGHDFYDYADKYLDTGSRAVIPADLPDAITKQIQSAAITAFRAIDGAGLARVDFFVERSDTGQQGMDGNAGRIIINEINTMPGFTSISMFPKMWEASGISYSELIDRLIDLAFERHRDKSRNLTSFAP
jgi:D-alanine-D-alanine ligase